MPTYLEYIGALSPRKGVGPSLRFPGFQTKPAPGAFNRGSGGLSEGVLGALNSGGGNGGDVDTGGGDDDDNDNGDDTTTTTTTTGNVITPTETPANDGNQITWLDELPATGQQIVNKMIEMGVDPSTIKKEDILARYFYDGKPDYRAISTFNSNYDKWKSRPSPDETTSAVTTTTTGGTTTTPVDTTTSTTTPSTTTTSGSTPATIARGDEDLAIVPGSTTKNQPNAGNIGVLNPSTSSTDSDGLSDDVKQVLMDLGVMDGAGQWTKPTVTIDQKLDGTQQILINGQTVSEAVIKAIQNQFPDVIANAPKSNAPAGDTHINVGGKEGLGETGIGVAVALDPSKEGLAGENVVYKDVTVDDVEEFRRNPFWWINKRARQLGRSAHEVWLDVKDKLGLSEDEKAAINSENTDQTSGSFAGFTDPGSVSPFYRDSTLTMGGQSNIRLGENEAGEGGRYAVFDPQMRMGQSPLSSLDIPEGRGLPYSKFPVDSDVYGDILIDQLKPDPNTLSSEIDRMVASSLPFVSVTGDDGTQYMYDKQTQQTYSLPDYMDLVEKRNTIGLPPGVNRMPGRLPSYGGYGYG